MKAILINEYGGTKSAQYEDVEKPTAKAGEVLIKVKSVGVNAQEYKVCNGLGEYLGLKLPTILGVEVAGTIESFGTDREKFAVGDRVYGYLTTRNAYAEYVTAKTLDIGLMPENLSFEEAATIPVGALTSWKALFDTANLQSGQRVLIIGAAGGVGSIAVQMAKAKGARVIAVAAGKTKDYAKSLGADQFIDYQTQDFTTLAKNMDVVLDIVGGDSLEKAYQSVKKEGFVVTLPEKQPIEELGAKYGIRSAWSIIESSEEKLNAVSRLVEQGKIKPHIERVFDLSAAGDALELLEKGGVSGKIVLRVN